MECTPAVSLHPIISSFILPQSPILLYIPRIMSGKIMCFLWTILRLPLACYPYMRRLEYSSIRCIHLVYNWGSICTLNVKEIKFCEPPAVLEKNYYTLIRQVNSRTPEVTVTIRMCVWRWVKKVMSVSLSHTFSHIEYIVAYILTQMLATLTGIFHFFYINVFFNRNVSLVCRMKSENVELVVPLSDIHNLSYRYYTFTLSLCHLQYVLHQVACLTVWKKEKKLDYF